jgi:CRISPR system Cascade subunit CasE
MYFSLITPEEGQEREAARQWTKSAYAEHQWLWRLFPAAPGTPRDFLFRRRDVDGLPRYYVVSKRPPLSAQPGWQIETKAYELRIEAGTRLRFDLRANPVVTRTVNGKSVRHDVVMHEKKRLLAQRELSHWTDVPHSDRPAAYDLIHRACTAWLQARAPRLGFEVEAEAISVDGYQRQAEKSGSLRFSTVNFSGLLTVRDAQAFATALCEGIGHAKAFGCGLLLVRPIV